MTNKIRPPVTWYGGKYYLANRIVSLFPPHHTYVEPFGGGASVLLNKPPSAVEVYNDLDSRLTRLFTILRDKPDDFIRRLTLTPYSEVVFEDISQDADPSDEVAQAVNDYVRWRQSFSSQGKSWRYTLHATRGGMAGVVSAWLSSIDSVLPQVIERLRRVQITQRRALSVIKLWDSPSTLFYLDPPYVADTRTSPNVYAFEMDDNAHRILCKTLTSIKGKAIISGYHNPIYDELLAGWKCVETVLSNRAAGGKIKRLMTECLWMNYTITEDCKNEKF